MNAPIHCWSVLDLQVNDKTIVTHAVNLPLPFARGLCRQHLKLGFPSSANSIFRSAGSSSSHRAGHLAREELLRERRHHLQTLDERRRTQAYLGGTGDLRKGGREMASQSD